MFDEKRISNIVFLKNIFFLLIYDTVMQNFEYLCASKSLYTYGLWRDAQMFLINNNKQYNKQR